MKFSIGSRVVLVAALFVSACAPKRVILPVEEFASWSDVVPQQTMVSVGAESGPKNINDVLANEEDLRRALDTLFPEVANVSNLGERIAIIRGGKEGGDERRRFEVLRGLGGVIADEFLDAAAATLNDRGVFDGTKRVYEFIYGQIEAYTYDKDKGSGTFQTVTYYTTVIIPAGIGPIISTTDAYRWNVAVGEGGFTVVDRDDSAPDGPFPGTIPFSQAMKDRVQSLGFQYKLWAVGTIIDIKDVWHKAPGSATFVRLADSDSKYDQTAENCIDMLFVNFPADQLGILKPPLYCLGRCKSPELVNTGV